MYGIVGRVLLRRDGRSGSFLMILCFLLALALPSHASPRLPEHTVYFENTDYELHVYRVYGKREGKTLLLIGGIQGDEPGGFMSADLYVDLVLAKGNLIVVPRANFQSIMLNRRQVNKDLNRTFSGHVNRQFYEARIVEILKDLIAQSDCLLNLHDGSGFYSPKWESSMRNPDRFGQSIIADCETYVNPETGAVLELGRMARSVAEEVNKHIKNPAHYFHFNNHRTNDPDSRHKEQRGSATYYAVYTCGIPAFGIETSKSLPLAEKVSHHNYAINAFMDLLGIIPETPGWYLDKPELSYILVSVNGASPVLVANHQTLYVRPGDELRVTHIEANYKRGLTVDLLGVGGLNDFNKNLKVTRDSRLIVRKDSIQCGLVYVAIGDQQMNAAQNISVVDTDAAGSLFFNVEINGQKRIFPNYGHVDLVKGDFFRIIGLAGDNGYNDVTVNFKGFVGNKRNNTGEDRGYLIDTGKDLLKRYSLGKEGREYQVVVTRKDGSLVGKLFVEVAPPVLKYLMIRPGKRQGMLYCCRPGDSLEISEKDVRELCLADMITNVDGNSGVKVFAGFGDDLVEWPVSGNIPCPAHLTGLNDRDSGESRLTYRLVVRRGDTVMGDVLLNIFQEKSDG